MAETLLNAAGKRIFAKHVDGYRPSDPMYEEYTDAKGRVKRRKRKLPEGLSEKDIKILRSVNRRAHYLDKGFRICGVRFGWTFVIGLIPGAGDVADAVLGYTLVIRKSKQADLPPWLVQRMLLNLAIGSGVGLVPIVGDVVLAMWRANSRNAALLEEYLLQRSAGLVDTKSKPAKGDKSKPVAANKGSSVPTAAATTQTSARPGPSSKVAGADASARSSSENSKRWWRRIPSKEKSPQIVKRDSRMPKIAS